MRNLLALLLFLPSLCLAQVPTYVPADGLEAWWALDGDGSDQSAQGDDGTVIGATPTSDRWGSSNAAMHFASIGDRIEFGEISNDIGLPNVGMTISIWFQGEAFPTSGQSVGQVCSAYYGPGNTQIRLEVVHGISNGPGHHLKYYWRCPNENDEPVSTDEFSTSDWNHYAMVVDPTDGEVRIYLNGSVVPELTSAYSASNDYFGGQSRNWMIGSYHPQINSVPHQFSGDIDDAGVWSRALTEAEIQALLLGEAPEYGCTDTNACNYDEAANADDGSCEYGCLYCGEGTVWNSATSTCVTAIVSGDIAEDCTMMNLQELAQNHLLLVDQLESCGTGPWSCGDPVTFWNYNYPTTAIGDQCWFSENVRTTQYLDGSAIQEVTDGATWSGLSTGGRCGFDNSEANVSAYGYLYNWHAVNQSSGLCPAGWHVPTDDEWTDLEAYVTSEGFVGTEGTALKAASGWGNNANGSNDFGFSGLPGGYRNTNTSGDFDKEGELGWWWSSTPDGSNAWYRDLSSNSVLDRTLGNPRYGFSVRCVKD